MTEKDVLRVYDEEWKAMESRPKPRRFVDRLTKAEDPSQPGYVPPVGVQAEDEHNFLSQFGEEQNDGTMLLPPNLETTHPLIGSGQVVAYVTLTRRKQVGNGDHWDDFYEAIDRGVRVGEMATEPEVRQAVAELLKDAFG